MSATAHGGRFTFNGFSGKVVGLSVEEPRAEIVDMTGRNTPAGHVYMVPTGDRSGGSVTVEFIGSGGDLNGLIKQTGTLSFTGGAWNVSRRVICESAQTEASVGDVVRGTLRFVVTDYYG